MANKYVSEIQLDKQNFLIKDKEAREQLSKIKPSNVVRQTVEIMEVTNVIGVPFTVAASENLVVYYNGVLLVPNANYTYDSSTNQITLNGFQTAVRDVVTFVDNFKEIPAMPQNIPADTVTINNPKFVSHTIEGALDELSDFISGADLDISIEGGSATEVIGDPLLDGLTEADLTFIQSGSSTVLV